MKIKRFEARNMSEALRMVKKEFGEDAVILSAKNSKKPGRLFGAKSGGQVIVTAAIDMAPGRSGTDLFEPPIAGGDVDTADYTAPSHERSAERISSILQRYQPITNTGRKKLRPKLVRLMAESEEAAAAPASDHHSDHEWYERLRSQGVSPTIARDIADQMAQLLPKTGKSGPDAGDTLAQIISARGWFAAAGGGIEPLRPVVLVGPHGAGKTATAAKLAADAMLAHDGQVAVLSLDHQRIAAFAELERYTRIMGVDLHTAADEAELQTVLAQTGSGRRLIVDTPGIALDDRQERKALSNMIECLGDVEVHLVMSACMREKVMDRVVDFYKPLGVNRLLFTYLDWAEEAGQVINQIESCDLPAVYFGNSPQVPDGLCRITPAVAAELLMSGAVSVPEERFTPLPVTVVNSRKSNSLEKYVANRNSDIFHEKTCKSVKRINAANMVAFTDPAQAREQGFKPCRMCCAELLASKPIDRLVRSRLTQNR